jgi:beta-glucosidase
VGFCYGETGLTDALRSPLIYPGQNGGQALAEILVGKVNPSGKLPVTFERRITDNPAYATFPKPVNQHPNEIAYSEGLYVGYRGYEKRKTKPLYAFGYGLSYTTFKYSDLDISPSKQNSLAKISFNASKLVDENELVNVSFTVTNTGKRAGAEVAQLYVGQENSTVDRPIKELKGFKKVYLQPGQSQTVTLPLNQRQVERTHEIADIMRPHMRVAIRLGRAFGDNSL